MATYTIGQAAKISGMSPYTLRFYDREGMLPFVDRDSVGNRMFKDSDFQWLHLINCFKKTGMPIKQIRQYVEWCMEGDSTLEIRLEAMLEHKKAVQAQIDVLNQMMETVDHKVWYYQTAVDAGTEEVHRPPQEQGA